MQQKKSYFKRYLELFHFLDWRRGVVLVCKIFYALQAIFMVQITVEIVNAVETGNPDSLFFRVKIFIALMIVGSIAVWLDDVIGSAEQGYFQKRILQNHLKDYIAMDQSETEKYGTGKFTNLFWTGTWNASDIVNRDGLNALVDGLGIVYAIVILAIKAPTFYHFLAITVMMVI
jgi:hypothetical protein